MVVVTMDYGADGERVINLSEHTGYKQNSGHFRVTFKDGKSGLVTQNPAPPEKTKTH